MTKRQTIQIRISESDKNKIDKYVGLLQENDPSYSMTSLIMDALENYYSEFRIEEDTEGNEKAVKGNKYVYKNNDYYQAEDVYKLSLEHKQLSDNTDITLSQEGYEKSKTQKINKLISDFLFQLAVQKKREEHQAISENENALIEELKKKLK